MGCALFHVIWRLSGVVGAVRLIGAERLNALSLSGTITWIESNVRVHNGREPSYYSSALESLLHQAQGVFIVQIEGLDDHDGVFHHAIAI